MVEKNVKLGKGVKIFDPKLVNIWDCQIGDYTFIGPFVEITNGVVIGSNCKIESHSFICPGVEIQNEVFVGHGVMFTNDLYPQSKKQVEKLKTLVATGASIGTNSTILGGLTIGKYSIIGAGAVVTKDVPDLSIVVGNPAKIIRQFKSIGELQSYIKNRYKTDR